MADLDSHTLINADPSANHEQYIALVHGRIGDAYGAINATCVTDMSFSPHDKHLATARLSRKRIGSA